jgi:hypothetical protein
MAEETSDFVERFNREGGPVPAADPEHLKMLWSRMRELEQLRDPGKTYGLGALGLDASFLGESAREKHFALTMRLYLLQSLLERDVLRDYLQDGELPDEVFATAAEIPCDKEEFGEAVVQLTMKQYPDADYSEMKREMIAHGYDPDAPKIDAKFLAWLRRG